MGRNAPRGSFIRSLPSIVNAWRERGNCQLVSKDRGILSTSSNVQFYSNSIPNVVHTNVHYDLLGNRPPSKRFQHGIASQHLGTSGHPYFGRPQTTYPIPAHNISHDDPQQSTSFPQSGLGPHPQSQELIELGLLYPPTPAKTSFGLPAEAATTSHRREPVDESELQVTNRTPR